MSPISEEYLDIVASAAEGIGALRRLVLELAVRGKIARQEPENVTAKDLLKQIFDEKGRLFAAGLMKRSSVAPGAPIDPSFSLPSGWEWFKLGEVCVISGGGTPPMIERSYWDGEIPWVSPKDMHGGDIVDSELRVAQKAIDDDVLDRVPVGSIVLVGRSGILRRKVPVQLTRVVCTINQDMKALTPIPPLDPTFIKLTIRGWESAILRQDVKQRTTVQSLVYDRLFSHHFGLPPPEEQSRILRRVDELMRLCDGLEEARTKLDVLKTQAAENLFVESHEPIDLESEEESEGGGLVGAEV